MKILFVTCAYPPYKGGGVAKLLTNLAAEFIKKKHQVYIFSMKDDPSSEKHTIERVIVNGIEATFVNVPMSSLTDFFGRYREADYNNPYISDTFKHYLSEKKPDIVHFHAIQALGANLITEAHSEGFPTVLTMHDMWWFCPNLFMTDLKSSICDRQKIDIEQCKTCLQDLYKFPDGRNLNIESFLAKREKYLKSILEGNDIEIVLTVSNVMKKVVHRNINRDVHVNENGISLVSGMIEKPINSHRIIFGFVGGKSEMKGYTTLIEAFRDIKLSNWELHIYDVDEVGFNNLRESFLKNVGNRIFWSHLIIFLNNVIKRFLLRDRMKYFPSYSDLEKHDVINTFDVVLVPSVVRESFSLITREALALHKPVICSNCGGPEEVVLNNVNGLIFETKNVEDLKLKINAILESPSLINKLKKNIDVHTIRSTEEQVNELEYIYKSLI